MNEVPFFVPGLANPQNGQPAEYDACVSQRNQHETPTRVLSRGRIVRLGQSDSPLSFTRPPRFRPAGRGPGPRQLRLDGKDAFDLAHWCGTCPLVFERLEGSSRTLPSDELQERLNEGIESIEPDVLAAVSALIPQAVYLPLLLSVRPELASPGGRRDYFANEQVAHRGVGAFWGLPESPRTPYYRAGHWLSGDHDHLFQFVVPMVPPSWNDQERVSVYEDRFRAGSRPTVLALTIVDRTQPFDSYDSHTGLIHFVLDGHHKLEAAARVGAEVTMLSMVSLEDSLAEPELISRIPDRIQQPPVRRSGRFLRFTS